jgi:hypothetical protein
MSQHPYPGHVVEAVANVLWPEMYVSSRAYDLAEKALAALWDASRVEVDRIGELPENTAFIDGDGFIASSVSHAESNWMENPVYAIYWGGSGD